MKKNNYIYLILTIITIIILFIISLFIYPIKLNEIQNSTLVYDQNNIEIWEIIKDNKIRHRFINLEEIPEFTKKSIILIEDKSFNTNNWIDFIAIIRAIKNNIILWKKIEGASTISTQVIRNNYWLNKDRTYIRKLSEFYLALVLNKKYSKSKILEYYLNNIYFWYLNYWISSASHYYFNKEIYNLTKAEQIALLVIPKNPYKYNPYKNKELFYNRFKKIVNYLNQNWLINNKEKNEILSEVLIFNYEHKNKLPYIIDFISKNKQLINKKNIQTTIDYNLTKKIENISKKIIDWLMWKNVWDYWILITDIKTNELKVMIWWIDYYLENWQVNSTIAKRQVGSTIKPFTYLLSFKDLWYLPSSTILDLPVQFNTSDWNSYSPKNYSLDYKWEVSLAEALSQSINIPAIKLVNKIWKERLYNFLKELWITTLDKDPDYYWLALTLWVPEIKLFELLQAYSIFTNKWNLCKIKIEKEEKNKCKKIIEEKYINMINLILTNRYFKLNWFPINSNLDFKNKNVFVKTWTSRNFRDNWSIWFTDNYMIWVWVWNKDWTYMKWVSWATWAWEIFKELVNYLEKNNNILNKDKIIYNKNNQKYLEILSPLNNSIYKIEKNKPKNISQIELNFKTNINYDNKKWFLNNKEINNNFIDLKLWKHKLKIILFKKWTVLKSSEVEIEVIK